MAKLRQDSDLYPSAQERLDYWASRLGGGRRGVYCRRERAVQMPIYREEYSRPGVEEEPWVGRYER